MFTRGDVKLTMYDFDSKEELYIGISKKADGFYSVVERLAWVRKEHKLSN